MSIGAVLARIRAALTTAKVPHMLSGSFASSAYGAPRTSQDIDIVIAPTRAQLLRLVEQFPDTEYYVSRDAALDALARREQFNLIDFLTGWKVDFIIRKAREFSLVEFDRRRPLEIAGVTLDAASAEDVLLSKLEWAKHGASERQLDDVVGILRFHGLQLDLEYINRWVEELDVGEQWRLAQAKLS